MWGSRVIIRKACPTIVDKLFGEKSNSGKYKDPSIFIRAGLLGHYKEDLYDWSDPNKKCKFISTSIQRPGLQRQSSKTGSLINCNEQKIALFRHGENVYAINEKCPHAGGPLHLGDIEEISGDTLCVRCPWHSWRFDLETGKVRMPKGQDRVAKVYPVTVSENGQLSIGFDEFSAKYFTGEIEF